MAVYGKCKEIKLKSKVIAYSVALCTYMTAWTHGGLARCTRYPKIGSVISWLVTLVQQDARFSANDGLKHKSSLKKKNNIRILTGSQEAKLLYFVFLNLNLTCRSRLKHSHQDDDDQRALQHASTVFHLQKMNDKYEIKWINTE